MPYFEKCFIMKLHITYVYYAVYCASVSKSLFTLEDIKQEQENTYPFCVTVFSEKDSGAQIFPEIYPDKFFVAAPGVALQLF